MEKTMDENQEVNRENKNSAKDEIVKELIDFKKICNSRCNICNSGVLKEVHDLRADGKNFNRIVEIIEENHNIKLSSPSLSRHFQTYNKFKLEMATNIIKNDVLEEVTLQSVHIQKTVELLDIAYEKIKARISAGNLRLDIGDLEKLVKMRYQVLNGQETDDKDMAMIFQKASDDYGLNLQQGVLFKM